MLSIKNLSIGYGKQIIQKELNLEAHPRDLICLVGTNGAGKSTLLRTIAGLQKPLHGSVYIDDKNLLSLNNHQRALYYSLVLTDTIQVPNLTVFDLVALGRIPHTNWTGALSDKDKTLIHNAIKEVNMTHKTHTNLNAISDGEKQRAVIAKALAQDTPLVLLDEPTAHLDLPNRIETMLLLRRLSVNTNKTFILSTHELDLALQMADKIWLMTPNNIEVGIPEDLMLTGKFQQAFGSGSYHFDANDGQCRIHHLSGNLNIAIDGDDMKAIWLKKALERCGCVVTDRAEITISTLTNGFVIDNNSFNSIQEVLHHILSNKLH